jgi:hypothetical protein
LALMDAWQAWKRPRSKRFANRHMP